MIPASSLRNQTIQEIEQPSRTWKIDFERGRVVGMTDGIDAVKQSVYCILKTERFRHLIYSFNYGQELNRVIGMSPTFVESEVRRLLNEALLQDDRITAIQNIRMKSLGDKLTVWFTVVTNEGSFDEGVEISV